MTKLYVYFLHNADGSNSLLVAAPNQTMACKLMGVSAYCFRNYGGYRTDNPELVSVAMQRPGVVYRRSLLQSASKEWIEHK